MEKYLAMLIASQLTQAACGQAPCPVSPDLSDPAAQAKNLQAWETFRAYYAAIVKALADAADWAPPAAGSILAGLAGNLAPAVTGGLTALGPVLSALVPGLNVAQLAADAAKLIGAAANPPKPVPPPSPPIKPVIPPGPVPGIGGPAK